MAYNPTVWANDTVPDIDADNMNKIEQGIADAHSMVEDLEENVSSIDTSINPGQELNIIPNRTSLVNGSWSGRRIVSNNSIVCTKEPMHVIKGSVLHIGTLPTGMKIAYGIYCGDNTSSSGYTSWQDYSNVDKVLEYTGEFVVQFKKTSEAAISPSEVTTEISVTGYDVVTEISEIQSDILDTNDEVERIDSEISDSDISKATVYQVNTSSAVETPTGTRLRIVIPVTKGMGISVKCTYGSGCLPYIYDSVYHALYAGSNYLQTFGVNSYTKNEVSGTSDYDGYLSISEKKDDGSSITENEKTAFVNATTLLAQGKYSKLYEDLAGGSFTIKNEIKNGTLANPANVNAIHTDNFVFVYPGDKVAFGTNKPLKATGNWYSYGYQTYDANKNVVRNLNYTWDSKSNILDMQEDEYYVRFVICEYDSNKQQVANRISDYDGYDVTIDIFGHISIPNFYYLANKEDEDGEESDLTTAKLNEDMNTFLVGISRYNTLASGSSAYATGYKKNLSFAVITDIHGSEGAFERFIEYVNAKKNYFDFALCLGDIAEDNPTDDVSWFASNLAKSEIPFLFTVGNHDVSNTNKSGITQSEARNRYFAQIESKGWLSANDFMGTGKCSWVKDFSAYSIRIISLFEYGNSTTIASGAPGSYCRRWMDSELLQWFADTLYDTPSGYAVIVLLHQVPYNEVNYIDDKFTAIHGFRQEPPHFLNTVDGNPIEEIVNAFMTSGRISKTYNSIASYELEKTATVEKDFSDRETNGSFIGYFCGHAHTAYVLSAQSYTDQKIVVVNTGSENIYQRSYGDINYDANSRNKDSFYCVGIDTAREKINLLQIGGQATDDLRKRDFSAIDY